MTLPWPKLFRVHVLSAITLVGPEHNILRDIRCSLRDDKQEEPIAWTKEGLRERDGEEGRVVRV
jgi:hypothetical protein